MAHLVAGRHSSTRLSTKWLGLSGGSMDPVFYQPKMPNDLVIKTEGGKVETITDWEAKKKDIIGCICWGGPGNELVGVANTGPKSVVDIP